MKRAFLLCMFLPCLLQAQSSGQVLARVLAEKGLIGAAELARVEAAAPEEATRVLAAMLHEKGVLTDAELARVSPVAGPRVAPAPLRQEPAPAVTSQSKFPITVYGTVLWNAFSNTAALNNQDVPLLASRQGSDTLGNDKSFGMTVRQSRFGLRYQGTQMGGARLSGQFEFDLFGGKVAMPNGVNMDLFRLRLAYGRLDWKNFSLLAGQDWAVFAPLNPTSLASFGIPALAASGNPWIRAPQLRAEFRREISDHTRLDWKVAALDPDLGDYPAEFRALRTPLAGERGRAPAMETRLGWTSRSGRGETAVGLSAHYGRGKNVALVGTQRLERGIDSWGVALDYIVPLHRRVALSGEIFQGRALGIFNVGIGQSVLPVGTPGEHGVEARGGWLQAQFQLHAKWQLNLAYGLEEPDFQELRVGDRSRNQTYMSNLLYRLSPHVTLGWEWRRFLTDFRNQRAANERGDHVNLAVSYIF